MLSQRQTQPITLLYNIKSTLIFSEELTPCITLSPKIFTRVRYLCYKYCQLGKYDVCVMRTRQVTVFLF